MIIHTLKGVKDNRVYISKNHHIIRATKSGGAIPINMTRSTSRSDVMSGGATNLNNIRNTLKNLKLSGVKPTKKIRVDM